MADGPRQWFRSSSLRARQIKHLRLSGGRVYRRVDSSGLAIYLEKIPEISINVFEYGNSAVALLTWVFPEANSFFPHGMEVLPEIIRMQEEKDSASCLGANSVGLFRRWPRRSLSPST